jgi:NAD(P)-dependent dehydrogenase (short-subunit alcohol dehydrogenase family)
MTQERTVLITGASSGIGEATAALLARQNYRVFAGVRRLERAPQLSGVEAVQLDVTDDTSVQAAVSSILERTGRIDGLVNNAGSSILGAIEETSVPQAQALFDLNVLGAFRMARAVLPTMRSQASGRIVNVSSVVGFLPAPYMGVYAATKHALEGLSESLDHEVRSFGIRVVLVQPGFTRTNIDSSSARTEELAAYAGQRERVVAHISQQISQAPEADTVAHVIERALRSPSFARLTVGSQAALLSRLRRWMPGRAVDGSLRKNFRLDA